MIPSYSCNPNTSSLITTLSRLKLWWMSFLIFFCQNSWCTTYRFISFLLKHFLRAVTPGPIHPLLFITVISNSLTNCIQNQKATSKFLFVFFSCDENSTDRSSSYFVSMDLNKPRKGIEICLFKLDKLSDHRQILVSEVSRYHYLKEHLLPQVSVCLCSKFYFITGNHK